MNTLLEEIEKLEREKDSLVNSMSEKGDAKWEIIGWVKIRFYEEKMPEARRLWDESRSLQGD